MIGNQIVDFKMREREVLIPQPTTYGREFPKKESDPAQAERPCSSDGHGFTATYRLSGPIGKTFYHTDYNNKGYVKPERTRIGSGNRRNNPHPPKTFMVWKFPPYTEGLSKRLRDEPGSNLTQEVMDRYESGFMGKSTYQSDFMGLPQGYKPKKAVKVAEDWRTKVPYTLDSCKRWSYQLPDQQPLLKGNTTRYGCNKIKHLPAIGTVPTVSRLQLSLKNSTTYEREYNERLTDNVQGAQQYQRVFGVENLRREIERNGSEKDKLLIQRAVGCPICLPPCATPRVGTPNWIQTWTGPV